MVGRDISQIAMRHNRRQTEPVSTRAGRRLHTPSALSKTADRPSRPNLLRVVSTPVLASGALRVRIMPRMYRPQFLGHQMEPLAVITAV